MTETDPSLGRFPRSVQHSKPNPRSRSSKSRKTLPSSLDAITVPVRRLDISSIQRIRSRARSSSAVVADYCATIIDQTAAVAGEQPAPRRDLEVPKGINSVANRHGADCATALLAAEKP